MSLADWDRRLMTPERALRMVGDWPVYFDYGLSALSQFAPEGGGPAQADRFQVNMRCCNDAQSAAMVSDGTVAVTTIGDLLSAVLRHMVTAHDLPLNQQQTEVVPGE